MSDGWSSFHEYLMDWRNCGITPDKINNNPHPVNIDGEEILFERATVEQIKYYHPGYFESSVSLKHADPNNPSSIIDSNVEQILQRVYLDNNPAMPIDENSQYLMDCRNCGCMVDENGKIMGDPSNDPQPVYRDGKKILIKDATSEELTYCMGALGYRICAGVE